MKIKRYIMGNLDTAGCNLKCSYCFFNQWEPHEHTKQIFDYSIDHMQRSLTVERLGGVCYITLCGDGETLLDYKVIELAKALLQNGHVVGIVTNGTLTNRLHQLNELLTEEEKIRCTMAFSLHYLELVRLNKLNAFFDNMKFLHNNKFSVHYSLVLCDEYIPYVGEIKKVCMDNIGFLPSVSVVRDVNDNNKIMTSLDIKEYEKIGKSFKSPGFDMQFNLASQKQTGFCYAGDWAFILNFKNGIMQQCQANFMRQNIFENPLEPIQFIPVGNNCKMPWCVCMQFQNYGIIPEVLYPSERECVSEDESTWINGEVWDFIDGKLSETNIEYSAEVKNMINAEYVQLNKKFPTIEI